MEYLVAPPFSRFLREGGDFDFDRVSRSRSPEGSKFGIPPLPPRTRQGWGTPVSWRLNGTTEVVPFPVRSRFSDWAVAPFRCLGRRRERSVAHPVTLS